MPTLSPLKPATITANISSGKFLLMTSLLILQRIALVKLHCMGKKWECMPIGYRLPFPNIEYVKCRSPPISNTNVCILLHTSYFGNKACKWNFNHNNVVLIVVTHYKRMHHAKDMGGKYFVQYWKMIQYFLILQQIWQATILDNIAKLTMLSPIPSTTMLVWVTLNFVSSSAWQTLLSNICRSTLVELQPILEIMNKWKVTFSEDNLYGRWPQ